MQARPMRAQERYAQDIMDYLFDNMDSVCTADAEGLYYRGSIHQLIKDVQPRAQAGEVVNILRRAGAITGVSHGLWAIHRRDVFVDEAGNPVDMDIPAPDYGHASQRTQGERNLQQLNKRITDLEIKVDALAKIVLGYGEEVPNDHELHDVSDQQDGS